jgi:cell division protein ZapE
MADFEQQFQSFAAKKNLTPDPMQDQAVKWLDKLYQELLKPEKKSWFGREKKHLIKGLYLWGGVGRGKTMIMDLFFNALPFKEKRRVHFNIFMLDVHNSVKILREDGKGQNPLRQIAQNIAKDVRVLCFDEFQVYDIADAMVLAELFRCLFRERVTIIATSNVAPDNLYKDGLQRSRFLPFIDVVKKHMDVMHLDSAIDYRQQAIREDGVYFIHSESRMLSLFEKLTFPCEPTQNSIKVKGRFLPIEKSCKGFAWVTFAELCEKPRAAADYQALAKSYDIIFINHVPKMGYDRRNEVKRFILLIDTLYDAGAGLVINAEAKPQKLYSGGDHVFEFERTISRLLEMQGENYLEKTHAVKTKRHAS